MNTNWKTAKLKDYIEINPKESIAKGTIAKKIAMDKLQPFCRDVPEYEFAEFTGGTKFRNGDTIMARITPCLENGKTSMVNVLNENEVGFGSTEYIVFRAKEGLTVPDYVYYLICSSFVREPAIKSMVGSSGRQRVQTDVLMNLEIEFPNIEEQTKISNVLKNIDDKISTNNKINSNLEKQLSLIYHKYFDNETRDVELGTVVETTSGGTPSRKNTAYYSDANICWVKSKELLGSYIIDTEEHINDLAINKSSAKLLPAHSVLIAMYGATVGAYGVTSKTMACNQAICALIENEKYPYTYLYQLAKESQQVLINMAVGSAQQNVSQILIKQLHIHSNIVKVQSFHNFALPIHQKIESIQFENKALEDLRNCLLPKLMSGELDVFRY